MHSKSLYLTVPAGRYVSFHTDKTVVETLSNYNLQPEVYLFYEHGHLKTQIHQGEEITLSPELCVFMKSPLASQSFRIRKRFMATRIHQKPISFCQRLY